MNYEEKRPLMEKLDQCLLDHATAAGTKDGGPQILDVYLLQGLAETHYYLKVEHDFKPDEVTALLQFTDPLTVARECWEERDQEKGFPICELLNEIRAYERFPLADPAGFAQDQDQMIAAVKAVLDQNMAGFRAEVLGMDKEAIIAQSAKIAAIQCAYKFMKNDFTFDPDDAEVLLHMENPLEFVAGLWPTDVDGLFDMNDLVGEAILDAKEAAGKDTPQHSREEVAATSGKPSVRQQLRAAAKEVSQRPFQEDRTKEGAAR